MASFVLMDTDIVPDVEYLNDLQAHSDRYSQSDVVILYVNIRSAINKWNNFEAYLAQLPISPDIIVVVETWLRESETKFYNLENYVAFHCTREFNMNQGRGGGTSVFVRNIPRLLATCCETICFRDSTILIIKLQRLNMHVIAIYRPEQTNRYLFNDKLGELLGMYKHAICIGDINMNLLDDDASIANYRATLLSSGHVLLNSEHPSAGTRNGNIIDHVFTDLLAFKYCLSNTIFSESDHNKLTLTVKMYERENHSQTDTIHVIDYAQIATSPLWNVIANSHCFDDLSNLLQQMINSNRRSLTKKSSSQGCKPWINRHIIDLIKQREFYFSYHRRFPQNEFIANEYIRSKRRASAALKNAKRNYFNQKMSSNIANPKSMWSTIKELMYNTSSTQDSAIRAIKSNGVLVTPRSDVCELFSDYFSDVSRDMYDADDVRGLIYIDTMIYHITTEIRLAQATTADVHEAIGKLKSRAATGQDGISAKFVKKFRERLVGPITNCINLAIETGIYPQSLKGASVVPILKSGDSTLCRNYRPISVLSSLNMVFEEILKKWLIKLLDSNNIIHPSQFGFTKNSNTETAVLHLTHFVADGIQHGQFTSVLFLDLKKAFDCVDHRLLMKKFSKLGLAENELSLLGSYLSNRSQTIKVGSSRSSIRPIPPIAVPQGSKIGPIMFNFMTNDIHSLELCGEIQLFADDTAVKYKANTLEQLQRDMQHDMKLICDWLANNHLKANAEKTKFMVFAKSERGVAQIDDTAFNIYMDNQRIERVRSYEYLGVVIDDKLHWHKHIDKVRGDIAPYVFALRKMRPFVTEDTATKIYNAFVASRLVYASPVWRNASNNKLQTLRVLQHSAIKSIRRLPWLTPSATLFSQTFLSLNDLLTLRLMLYIHKIINNEIRHSFNLRLISNMHGYPTRNNGNYYVGLRGGRTEEANVLKHGLYRYNLLPDYLKRESTINFKKKLRMYLSDLVSA